MVITTLRYYAQNRHLGNGRSFYLGRNECLQTARSTATYLAPGAQLQHLFEGGCACFFCVKVGGIENSAHQNQFRVHEDKHAVVYPRCEFHCCDVLCT